MRRILNIQPEAEITRVPKLDPDSETERPDAHLPHQRRNSHASSPAWICSRDSHAMLAYRPPKTTSHAESPEINRVKREEQVGVTSQTEIRSLFINSLACTGDGVCGRSDAGRPLT